MNYTDALHRDEVEMVGFFHAKKLKHGYHPSLGRVRSVKCLPGFRKQLGLNLESHLTGWSFEQTNYPLSMKE
jgi:hypothetical protein